MKRGPLLWMLAVLGLLLLAEVALVVTVLASDKGGDSVRNAAVSTREYLLGKGDSPGALERARTNVGDAGTALVRLFSGERRDVPRGDTKFAECITCHPTYATDRRFSATYIDHAQHVQLGLSCAKCHADTAHPNPELPSERICAACHEKAVNTKGKCTKCHPPGSLPHFYQLGFPRDAPVACDTCHKQGAFAVEGGGVPLPVVDPSNKTTCLKCHEEKTCNTCHGTHPADWIRTHGPTVSRDGSGLCGQCHDLNTCVTQCHANRSI